MKLGEYLKLVGRTYKPHALGMSEPPRNRKERRMMQKMERRRKPAGRKKG